MKFNTFLLISILIQTLNWGERINSKFPNLKITTVIAQFKEGIEWINKNQEAKNVYFFQEEVLEIRQWRNQSSLLRCSANI